MGEWDAAAKSCVLDGAKDCNIEALAGDCRVARVLLLQSIESA